jgi:hypothetical protein
MKNPELIRAAYLLFLGREPESEEVLELDFEDYIDIRNYFITSHEFIRSNPSLCSTDILPGHRVERVAGRTAGDVDLLSRFADSNATAHVGYYTDFAGVRTPTNAITILRDKKGIIISQVPVPDDSTHADAVEYCCLYEAIEQSADTFTMFELGAGWGPWMAQAASGCMKKGFSRINITGVEGEAGKIPLIKEILTINGFRKGNKKLAQLYNNVYSEIIHGVVTVTDEIVEFPAVGIEHYGASVMDVSTCDGYSLESVQGYSIKTLLENYEVVDYMHFDIQGHEYDVVQSAIDVLSKKVRFLCIGTHSRKIEGDLIELLYNHGWELRRESPCLFTYEKGKRNLVDRITQDGLQFWRNEKL